MNWSEFSDTRKQNISSVNPEGAKLKPSATPEIVLGELYELLETYGPTWYNEELSNRIHKAITILPPKNEQHISI